MGPFCDRVVLVVDRGLIAIGACSPEVRMVQTTQTRLVSRLLGTSIVLISAGAVLTLAAQPSSFWSLPQTAIRFDGLPIHSSTNPMFDFFLGRGWPAYLAGVALYGAAVWLLAAVLPKRPTMVTGFTVILGLSYCGSNWVIVRWHTGMVGAAVYITAVAVLLAGAVFPSVEESERNGLRRLCWVMAFTIAIDGIFTLIGQPASYWQNPATVHEANPMSKFFLEKGWWAFAAYNLVEIAGPWLLALRVAPVTGWAVAFGMALGGFFGGSNWLFYEWRLGLQAPLIYAMLLSIVIVGLVLKHDQGATPDELSANVAQGLASNSSDGVSSCGSSYHC